MNAEYESISGMIRVFEDGDQYGDVTKFRAMIRHIDRRSVEIIGIRHKPTPSVWKAIRTELRSMGVERVLVVRFPNGRNGDRVEKWFTDKDEA